MCVYTLNMTSLKGNWPWQFFLHLCVLEMFLCDEIRCSQWSATFAGHFGPIRRDVFVQFRYRHSLLGEWVRKWYRLWAALHREHPAQWADTTDVRRKRPPFLRCKMWPTQVTLRLSTPSAGYFLQCTDYRALRSGPRHAFLYTSSLEVSWWDCRIFHGESI